MAHRIPLREEGSKGDVAQITDALVRHGPGFDFEWEGHELQVYVDQPHNPRRTEKAVLHVLHESGLGELIQPPFRIGRWDGQRERYIFPGSLKEPEPAVPFDEIAWAVAVKPASAFDWRPARAALVQLGRSTIRETDRAIEVGAGDESDAEELQESLADVACIGETTARPLNWFQRWRVREQFLGNYGVEDPTQLY